MVEIIQTELVSGTTLCGGKYVIEKKIGSGGFGITYLARHTILDRKYAIKEFFMSGYNVRNNTTNHVSLQGLEVKDFDRVRKTFINEARTLANLNNEAIVKVIDIFDENGTSYMVMPFVEGTTLKSMVEKDGPMEYEMAVNYMVQICEALKYIHSNNILHRDVTPDNVIVTPEQKIVLIDFGSARKFIDNKTQRHTTIVKPGYAPLEQHSARSRKGAFTDIYSVGAVFYYLLTGERPMDATERVLEKMAEPIELNPNIPSPINAIIMKAMYMDGEMRYQSAQELINDIFSDEPVSVSAGKVDEVKNTGNQLEVETNSAIQRESLIADSDFHQNNKDENLHKWTAFYAGIIKIFNIIKTSVSHLIFRGKERKFNVNEEDTKDNNENTIFDESGRRKNISLIVVAITLALLAVSAIVAIVIYKPFGIYSNSSDVQSLSKVVDDTIIVTRHKLSTGEEYDYKGERNALGIPNGKGKAFFAAYFNDSCVYDGHFENGNMNGYGELTFKTGIKVGRVYKAIFVNNCINDTCTVISGPNVFKGTLNADLDYDCGEQTNSKSGNIFLIKNGEWNLKME